MQRISSHACNFPSVLFLLLPPLFVTASSADSRLGVTQTNFQSFIDLTTDQNPLNRDLDEVPGSPNDHGSSHHSERVRWLLATTFQQGLTNSGKVWAIPRRDPDEAAVLISGLSTPTDLCFDNNHDFLYVCDPVLGTIYQYEIDWDSDETFSLASTTVVTIADGVSAQDCSVDTYGNLYYLDSKNNSISIVAYLDLWGGYVNEGKVLYTGEKLSEPVGIDVYDSKTIYFVNNKGGNDTGLLNTAPTIRTQGSVETAVGQEQQAWGVAVSEHFAYYSSEDGSVWAYRIDDSNVYLKTSALQSPHGLCYGQYHIYVADYSQGEIFSFRDSKDEEELTKLVKLQDVYGIECVNEENYA